MTGSKTFMQDVVEVVKLGEHYQVKFLRALMVSGWQEYIDFGLNDDLVPVRPLTFIKNDKKLKNNISRALTTCRNIALSNPWDWFVTLTINPKKKDRFDLNSFHKDVTAFIKGINRRFGSQIKFLLVPERHKDGAWHMHGLIFGLPDDQISVNENGFFDWDEYSKNFGFISLSPVVSHTAVSLYITKHLGKQIYNGAFEVGSHLYYCSRGLSRGEIISYLKATDLPPGFTFQYSSEDGSYKSSFFEDGSFLKDLGLI